MPMRMRFAKTATWGLGFLILLLLWVVHPLAVHAQGAGSGSGVVVVDTPSSPFGELLLTVMKIVFSALGIVATWLTTKAITYFQNKTKIDIPAATEQMLFAWADQSVGLAAEKAHQILQKTGTALSGEEKLNIASQFVLDLAKKHNLEGVLEDKVKNYIEAKLGIKRIDDMGVSNVGTPPADSPTVPPPAAPATT